MTLLNIIGAGRLGKTIGHLLVKHNLVQLGSICNSSKASSLQAIQFIRQGSYCPQITELQAADLTLISTPDELIPSLSEELSLNPFLKQGSVVLHCSGVLSSDVFYAVREKGCYVASIHPMKSFAKPELSIEHYKGTYCALEGDKEAILIITPLFDAIGSITYQIDKNYKSLYHAAGVFASNYLVTLTQQALLCMKQAGVEQEIARSVITQLMQGSLDNLKQLSPEQSLTGPIKRGDNSTIQKHLQALSNLDQKQLYSVLGKATLGLTEHREGKKREIEELFAP